MLNIKNIVLFLIFFHNNCTISNNSIIILYGCSSAGKTSIAHELLKILPGTWKYIPSNQFNIANRNVLLWKHINTTISKNCNVIVDTHNLNFLIDPNQKAHILTILLYCSPQKLIEHVLERNSKDNPKNYRALHNVFNEYCSKYTSVKKNQHHIDTLHKDTLQKNYNFWTSRALKIIINKFFTDSNQHLAYIAPFLKSYDCCINTGKISITECAQKIQDAWILKSGIN